MATKIEKLFDTVKDYQWEYAKARFINEKEFTLKDNMDSLENTFVGVVKNRDSRDGFLLKYTCPMRVFFNEEGRIKSIELNYDEQEWNLVKKQ